MDLSIVVPCYNEEGSLPLLFGAVDDAFATSGVSYELVLVNDGSSDGTSHLLHELPSPASAERIVVVDFSRNFGKESALLAGLQHAEGDAVGLMDADLQQPPATLLEMYRMLQANPSADCVAAFQEHRNEGAVLSFFKHAFYKTFDATSRLNVMPDASDFRVFHRRVADLVATLVGLVLLVEVVVEQFINPAMPSGYPTLLCVLLLMGGLILVTLGVIGEYIARIYIETKRRPAYIAKSVEVRTSTNQAGK